MSALRKFVSLLLAGALTLFLVQSAHASATPVPASFAKIAPANGAVNQPTTLDLRWSASSDVHYYETCIDTTNDNACAPWVTNGISNNKTLGGLAPNTVYYWHVRAINGAGTTYADGSATGFWSFTTGGAPGTFGKSAPANGAIGQSTSATLSWSPSPGAVYYEICYDNINDNLCTSWLANGSGTAHTISGLTPGITYYWQARAVSSFGVVYADGSAASFWSFKTGSPPSIPAPVSPADGTLTYILRPTFDWNNSTVPGVGSFKNYELQLDVTNTFATALSYMTFPYDINASSYTPPADLARAATYYWRVRAFNSLNEASAWSDTWNVRIAYAPPTLTSPANGSILSALKPTFTWNVVPGATSYTIQISRYNAFNIIALSATTSDPNFTPLKNLLRRAQYHWRVRVNGPYGPSEWTVFNFRTR